MFQDEYIRWRDEVGKEPLCNGNKKISPHDKKFRLMFPYAWMEWEDFPEEEVPLIDDCRAIWVAVVARAVNDATFNMMSVDAGRLKPIPENFKLEREAVQAAEDPR